MPSLTSLNLSNNRLSTLPKFKKGSSSVTRIDLSNNKFNQVPYTLINCTSLSYLNLSYNKILRLPEWLASVGKLDDVRLEGVPLVKADDKRDFQKMMQLLKIKLDNASKVNEIKVIVAGPSKVGKMHFTTLLCKDDSKRDSIVEIGDRNEPLFVRKTTFENSNDQVDFRFNVWEISGLSEPSTVDIEKLLYTKYAIYVIVFDTSLADDTEVNKLWAWLDAIAAYASPSCVLFLIYNSNQNMHSEEGQAERADVKLAEVLLTPLIKHFSKLLIFSDPIILAFSENSQLETVVDVMYKTASFLDWTDGQPYMGRLIRNTAVAFKEEISALGKLSKLSPVIFIDEMQRLTSHYKNFQINEPKEIAKISSFINDVGLILSFSLSAVPLQFLSVYDVDWFLHAISNLFAAIISHSNLNGTGISHAISGNINSSVAFDKEWLQQQLLSSSIFTSTLKMNNSNKLNQDVVLTINAFIAIFVDHKLLLSIKNDKNPNQYIMPTHLPNYPSAELFASPVLRVRWRYTLERFFPQRNWIHVIDSIIKQLVFDNDIPVHVWRNCLIFKEHDLSIVYSPIEQSITMLSSTFSPLFKQVRRVLVEILQNAIVEIVCPKCIDENRVTPAAVLPQDCIQSVIHSKKVIECQWQHQVELSTIIPHLLVTSTAFNMLSHVWKRIKSSHGNGYEINTLRKAVRYLKNEMDFERVHDKTILLQEYNSPSISSSLGLLINIALHHQTNNSQFSLAAFTFVPPHRGELTEIISDNFDGHICHIVVHRIAVQLAYAIRIAPSLPHSLKNVLLWSLNAESALNCSFAIKVVNDPKLISNTRRVDCWKFYIKNIVEFAKSTVLRSSCGTLLGKYHSFDKLIHDQQNIDLFIRTLSQVENQLLSNVLTVPETESPTISAHSVIRLRQEVDTSQGSDPSFVYSNKYPEVWLPLHGNLTTNMKLAIFKPSSMTLKTYPIHSFNPKKILAVKVCSANVWVSSILFDDLSCISIFDVNSRMIVHNIKMKNNAFTCIAEVFELNKMYLGTKAGFLFDFPSDVEKIKASNSKPRHKRISEKAIVNLVIFEQLLWISTADNRIYLLQCNWNLGTPVLKEFWLDDIKTDIIFTNIMSSNGITYSYDSDRVCFIDPKLQERFETVAYYNNPDNSIIITEVMKQIDTTVYDAIISSVTEANGCLWVGLSTGHILIFHRNKLIYHMQPYCNSIKSLCTVSFVLHGMHEFYVLSCGEKVKPSLSTNDMKEDVLMFWYAPSQKVLSQMILLENSNGCYLESYHSLAKMIRIGDFNDKMILQLVDEGSHVETSQKVSKDNVDKTLEQSESSSSWGSLQMSPDSEQIIDIHFSVRPTFQLLLDKVTHVLGSYVPSSSALQFGYRLRQHEMLVSVSSDDELNCYLELINKSPLLLL